VRWHAKWADSNGGAAARSFWMRSEMIPRELQPKLLRVFKRRCSENWAARNPTGETWALVAAQIRTSPSLLPQNQFRSDSVLPVETCFPYLFPAARPAPRHSVAVMHLCGNLRGTHEQAVERISAEGDGGAGSAIPGQEIGAAEFHRNGV